MQLCTQFETKHASIFVFPTYLKCTVNTAPSKHSCVRDQRDTEITTGWFRATPSPTVTLPCPVFRILLSGGVLQSEALRFLQGERNKASHKSRGLPDNCVTTVSDCRRNPPAHCKTEPLAPLWCFLTNSQLNSCSDLQQLPPQLFSSKGHVRLATLLQPASYHLLVLISDRSNCYFSVKAPF